VNGLIEVNANGLYCAAGDFYIDPWGSAGRALITHAHSDHTAGVAASYLTAAPGQALLRARLGTDAAVEALPYGQRLRIGEVQVSFHPAGHILGSAQIRLERAGEVWVVSGDYKLAPDPTCEPFEPIRCHTFITESTFGLPIYRWPAAAEAIAGIHAWWRANQEAGKASVLFAYALGKAQRVLAGLDPSIGPIYTHGAVENWNQVYRAHGVGLPPAAHAASEGRRADWSLSLVIAPPSAAGTPWMRRFGSHSTALASGWMRIRGTRRRRSLDRGFVLSDHADWPALLSAIEATGAGQVWVTHGYRSPLVRWLREKGLDAHEVETRYEGERDEGVAAAPEEAG
jgi:putative mRNA 3-end processing factor